MKFMERGSRDLFPGTHPRHGYRRRADFGAEMIVDNFAGGGGASMGIEQALGRPVDLAINHDLDAIAMHSRNHPDSTHVTADVFDVDPRQATRGRRVGLAWFSPDCTHHSKARGGKPREKNIRALAWVVIKWAAKVRPRVIILENVEEFREWCPLVNGQPCKKRRGQTFNQWVGHLRKLGYAVEWRELRACDYGAPTIRKRLFVVARCDGRPIVWPAPTHGDGPGLKPYRTAAEIIDWSEPCHSIFLTPTEVREMGLRLKRPLADATLRRIAKGVMRYVVEAAEPFIVPLTHHGDSRVHGLGEPVRTVTGANRGEFAVCVPTLVQTGYGERTGQSPRVPGLDKPLGTVVGGGGKHALVTAFMAKHYGGMVGCRVDTPLPTTTARGTQNQLVVAHLSHLYGSNAAAGGGDPRAPLPTVTAGGRHAGLVAALLVKYYGTALDGQDVREPLHTVPSHGRFGLVTVNIDGDTYVIEDIGMRMLTPRELARAQGFPESYLLTGTKTSQIDKIGNAVPPAFARALTAANVPELCADRRSRRVADVVASAAHQAVA